MKCAVEGCTQEASKNHGFEQTAEIHGVRIKVSGLLCEECWRHITYGREQPKQEYCAGCGIAFWKRITGEPVLTHMLNGKKYCNFCFKQQQAQETEPLNRAYQCVDCHKNLGMMEAWRHYNKRTNKIEAYCQTCHEKLKADLKQSQKEKCVGCGKSFSKLFLKPYCIECFQKRQNQQKEEIKCADCGGTLKTSQFHSTIDAKIYCYPCYLKRAQKEHAHSREHIRMDWDPLTEEIFQKFFGGSAHFYSGSTAGQQQQTKTTSGSYTYLPTEIKEAFKALGIEPAKDTEAIKKAYKAKAIVTHPDIGGSHQDMVKLNKAKDTAIKWAGER